MANAPGYSIYGPNPQYLGQIAGTRTSTTTGEVTPENFMQYWNAAYGGVPMGVDTAQLRSLWEKNVIQPGMEAGRRQAARQTGMSGAAPGAGNEAWKMRQLRGQYGTGLAQMLSQA